jgi:hypothetical protein
MNIVVSPPFWQRLGLSHCAFVVGDDPLFIRSLRTGIATKTEMEKTHIQKLKADDYKASLNSSISATIFLLRWLTKKQKKKYFGM